MSFRSKTNPNDLSLTTEHSYDVPNNLVVFGFTYCQLKSQEKCDKRGILVRGVHFCFKDSRYYFTCCPTSPSWIQELFKTNILARFCTWSPPCGHHWNQSSRNHNTTCLQWQHLATHLSVLPILVDIPPAGNTSNFKKLKWENCYC